MVGDAIHHLDSPFYVTFKVMTFLLVPALLPDGDGHCPALSRNLQTCELHILELASLHPATYQLPLAASAEAAQLLSEK